MLSPAISIFFFLVVELECSGLTFSFLYPFSHISLLDPSSSVPKWNFARDVVLALMMAVDAAWTRMAGAVVGMTTTTTTTAAAPRVVAAARRKVVARKPAPAAARKQAAGAAAAARKPAAAALQI